MRTPGQVERDLHTVIAAGGPIAECAVGEWLPEVVEGNAAYFVAAWNVCDKLELTAEQLNEDAIGRLVEVAKEIQRICKCEFRDIDACPMTELAEALAPFTKKE